MNERLRWTGPEPEPRKKATKKEIKRGGGKFSVRKERNTTRWSGELQKLREEEE